MSIKNNILDEIKLYPNNNINNDPEIKHSKSKQATINLFARWFNHFKLLLMIFCIGFNKFRFWLKEIFFPNENAPRNWRLFLGTFLRMSVVAMVIAGFVPLISNSLIPEFEYVAYTVIAMLCLFYFLRWFTYDLKFDELPHKRWLRFLSYPFKLVNLLYLAIWLVPLVIICIHGYDGLWYTENGLTQFKHSVGATIWLIFLLYLSALYAEVQYLGFSKGLLVLNYVFEKNAKIISVLMGSLLVIVLIFSVITMNVEAMSLTTEQIADNSSSIAAGGFEGWFNSFYMVFITFTTIGFGDVTPITEQGRAVVMVSAIFGVAFYSLFTSIIVNGFIQYLDDLKQKEITRKERMYNEALNELNIDLQEGKISKSIYDLKVRKLSEDIKSNRDPNKKKTKLKEIEKKNLKIHK